MTDLDELWARLGADEDLCARLLADPAMFVTTYELTRLDVAGLIKRCADGPPGAPSRTVQAALFRLLALEGSGNLGDEEKQDPGVESLASNMSSDYSGRPG